MRLAVTGRTGQVALSLAERGAAAGHTVLRIGRPDLDLARPDTALPALAAARPDIVVSAAALTAVDAAERAPEMAMAVNGEGAGAVARAAAALGVPLVHLSTDYVFDGAGTTAHAEHDTPAPINAYGASKLAGEVAVAAAGDNHLILRVAWVHSPFGSNFVRTMLQLAGARAMVRVVGDQTGHPTYAPDIADAILALAVRLAGDADPRLRGLFHLAPAGAVTRACFAEAIFSGAAARGGPSCRVETVATADYPTPARRPLNSRLDAGRLRAVHGIVLPHWRDGLARGLDRLVGPLPVEDEGIAR